jgi:uncharacterized protein
MKDGIPLRVKASVSVSRSSLWHGAIPIGKLPRLVAVLTDSEGELQVDLAAERDSAGAPRLRGQVAGQLGLTCQSCMADFRWPLRIGLDLRLVFSEAEERRLLHECEPFLVEEDTLHLHDLVEEEALLAIPIAPRCAACGGE